MTETSLYQAPPPLAVPAARDIDSWLTVCQDVIKLANVIYDTPFVPDGLRGSAPAVAAAVLAGREMGLGPMTSLQHIHVIKGKPGQSALLMRALVEAAGHKWEDADVSDTRATVRGCRRGESSWAEATFTADQAKRAGVDLGRYPQDKLYARATVRLARRKFADVIMGMPYSAEELEDGMEGEAAGAAVQAPARRRTARRAVPGTAVPAVPDETAPSGTAAGTAPMPPLPGEDGGLPDPPPGSQPGTGSLPPGTGSLPSGSASGDGGEPGTVTRAQINKLAVLFAQAGFARDEREQRLATAEEIVGRPLEGTSRNLSKGEASALIDTLERCGSRDRLTALLASGEMPDDGESQDQAPGAPGPGQDDG